MDRGPEAILYIFLAYISGIVVTPLALLLYQSEVLP